MADFLLRGGASANSKAPKLALRDETAMDERGASTFLGDERLKRMPKAESSLMKTPTAAETCATLKRGAAAGGGGGAGFFGKAGQEGVLESRLLQRSTAGLTPGIPRSHMSGYSGHVRGMSEVCGRSYSKCSAIALAKDPKELVLDDLVPSAPQATDEIPEDEPLDPEVTNSYTARLLRHEAAERATPVAALIGAKKSTNIARQQAKPRHLPGYTGHIPGLAEAPTGVSFSRFTEQRLERLGRTRGPPIDARGERRRLAQHNGGGMHWRDSRKPQPRPKLVIKDVGLKDIKFTQSGN